MNNLSSLSGPQAAHSDFVGDVQQLQALKQGPGSHTKEGLERVAREFESLYLKMMLDSMRAAEKIWSKDNPLASREQDMFRDMLDGQLSKDLSHSGSLGLADMLVKQLSPFVNDDASNSDTSKSKNSHRFIAPHDLPQTSIKAADSKGLNSNITPSSRSSLTTPVEQQNRALKIDSFAGQPDAFAAALLPLAIEPAAKLGVDPRLLVAQAALETGWGKSLQNDEHGFNLFGIKANDSWKGERAIHPTHEVYNTKIVREQGVFRQYQSLQESFHDYVQLIQDRYSVALESSTNPSAYMNALKAGGYATDPHYADKVMAVYESPRLQQTTFANYQPKPMPVLAMQSTDPRLDIW